MIIVNYILVVVLGMEWATGMLAFHTGQGDTQHACLALVTA